MEKDNNNISSGAMLDAGNWMPVDAATLGFTINAKPNQIVAGPDGNYYRVNKPEATFGGVNSNAQNAVPKPSSIVQMPPIVQPIALVPYTSQNQPLLQYDPYSRPVVEPQVQPKAPQYVKKAYKGISLAGLVISVVSLVAMLIMSVGVFVKNNIRPDFKFTGLEAVKSLIAMITGESSSDYYTYRIETLGENADFITKFVAYGLPILTIIVMVFFFLLVVKYIIKLLKKESPRGFSACAFLNVILSLSVMLLLMSSSNSEVIAELRSQNMQDFIAFKSSIYMGVGIIISFITSLVLFILPFFSRKNAYVLEKDKI